MTPTQFFDDLADLYPDDALLLVVGGAVVAASPAFTRQLGRDGEAWRNRPLTDFVATAPDALEQYLRACRRSRQKVLGSLSVRHQDGQLLSYRVEGKLLSPRVGANEAVVVLKLAPKEATIDRFLALNQRIEDLSREIARRREAEQEARAQREWLHVTLSSIGDAVIATDTEGRVSFMNRVAETMTGWRQEEAAGQPVERVFRIINEETRLPADNPALRVLAEGAVVGLANHTLLIAQDGTERPIDDSGAPIHDGDEHVIGAVLVFRDVTERRRLERELRLRAETLAENDRRKDEWIAMLAHELRGPLSPIRTGVQVLQLRGPPDPDLQEARSIVVRQTEHLARLIEDLLDVTRITRGQITLRDERIDLARLIQAAADDCRPALQQAGLTLTVRSPETPVWVHGDATRLTQVFVNLLDNARKFTEPEGAVSLTLDVHEESQRAVVQVRDSGAGIEPEMVSRLFQPLNQADRSLHRTKGGLGLGLFLVKGLVELHGGEVEAHSDGPGQGTEFIVRLPTGPEPPALTPAAAPVTASGKAKRVLIIEDNPDSANTLQLLLELLGHNVQVARTGPEGVQAALAWRPDVIISDIGLPGLDGYGVARELRRQEATAATKLIAITGYGGEEDRKRAQESGFNYVITKPAEPSILMQLLANGA